MKRLSRNFLALLSADLMRRLLGFISVAYLARILGKGDFGAINIGFAVLAYTMVLGAAGFPMFGTKQIARGESPELISRVIGTRLITTIIVLFAAICSILLVVRDGALARLIILFSCAIIPQVLFLDWFFQGKETMGIVSTARVAQAAVYLLVVLLFVKTAGDVMWVAAGAVAGEFIAANILLARFRLKYRDIRLRFQPSFKIFKQSFPLAVGVVLSTLVINYPPIALGFFNTTSEVGIYSAASKFVYFLMMGDRILLSLLIPASARKHSNDPETLRKMLHDTVRWILLLALPVAVGGTLIANDLITIVFGAEYSGSAAVLQVLIWYFLLTMLHSTFTAGLIGAGGERLYGKIMLATAFLYFVSVSAGALWFGPVGTAFGVVVAEGFSLLLINRAMSTLVKIDPPGKLLPTLFSLLVMAICVAYTLQYGLFMAVISGICIYCALVMILHIVSRNDIKTLLAKF